jgi:hypothetical protein
MGDIANATKPARKNKKQVSPGAPASGVGHSPRMKAAARKKAIIAEAISYFAHEGLDGGTLALAKRPIFERLTKFYRSCDVTIWTNDRLRLIQLGGLNTPQYTTRGFHFMREHIFPAVVRGVRQSYAPALLDEPMSAVEIECVHTLHGAMFHLALRRYLDAQRSIVPSDDLIEAKVVLFLIAFRQLWQSFPSALSGRKISELDWKSFLPKRGRSSSKSASRLRQKK